MVPLHEQELQDHAGHAGTVQGEAWAKSRTGGPGARHWVVWRSGGPSAVTPRYWPVLGRPLTHRRPYSALS